MKKIVRNGREGWQIQSDGKILWVRKSSIRAMEEAMEIYSRTLQRLAHE